MQVRLTRMSYDDYHHDIFICGTGTKFG
jgi:hypothetical protein